MTPISKLADGIFAAVAGYVARRLEPLAAELAELKKREPPKDGKSVEPEEIKAMLAELVTTAVRGIPPAREPSDLLKAVDEAVAKIEKPKDGTSVHPDTVARMVQEAVEKAASQIRVPKDGRDALQIEPLPSVDVGREYPRGTWALHAGGTVCAFRATTPGEVCENNGWQVALNGIAEVAVDLADDGRTVGVAMSMTDGTVLVKKLHFPVVLDKGVFNYEKEYARGDNVTWGGSCWIAQKDGLLGVEPRGIETGWRLSTKKGQNGKDGVIPPAPPATVKL